MSHPNKEVRKALKEADQTGFRIREKGSHIWGRILCGCGETLSVFSTPKVPEEAAYKIRDFIRKHGDHERRTP